MKEKIKIISKKIGILILFASAIVVAIDFWHQKSIERPLSQVKDAFRNGPEIPKIVVYEPMPSETVQSPLTISGEASEDWFFDDSFPITLSDRKGKVISRTQAVVLGPAQNEDMILFEATLEFEPDLTGRGKISFTRNDKDDDEFYGIFDLSIKFD